MSIPVLWICYFSRIKISILKAHIPNVLTSLNLFCGCIAAVLVFRGDIQLAAYFIFVAAFFDMMDGMVARRVDANSAYGKELDSLADMVTFGFVPGAIMFHLMSTSGIEQLIADKNIMHLVKFSPFVITIFSALRLAKFNLDTRQSSSFLGLPTPANTLLILSYPLILMQYPGRFEALFANPIVLVVLSLISCFLLVSEIPLFALKFKTTAFAENIYQYILIGLAVILIPFFKYAAIPFLIISYLFLSFIQKANQSKS